MTEAQLIASLIPRSKTLSFSNEPVHKDDLLYLMQVARLAPSARNTQIWFFTIISDSETIRQTANRLESPGLGTAPVIITAQAGSALFKRMHHEQPFYLIDVPIAMTHISLGASEKGLAVEWVLVQDEPPFIQSLNLDASKRLVAIGFAGFPAESDPLDELKETHIFKNKFPSVL